VGGVVVEDGKGQAVVSADVHHRRHAERPVVDFGEGQVAAEASQGGAQVVPPYPHQTFFPGGRDPVLGGGVGTKTR
jgi:hypothetical protein